MIGTTTVLPLAVVKFRKSGTKRPLAPLAAVAATTPSAIPATTAFHHSTFQHHSASKKFPMRVRRAPLTDDEIESINEGGAAAATAAAESSNREAAAAAAAAAASATAPTAKTQKSKKKK